MIRNRDIFSPYLSFWLNTDAVAVEREKDLSSRSEMTPEEQDEYTSREQRYLYAIYIRISYPGFIWWANDILPHILLQHSIFFGQLGSFALHMLSLDVSMGEVKTFITKQCLVNGLTDEQCDALLVTNNDSI